MANLKPKNSGQFGAGNPGKPRGAKTRTTKVLREAILIAAERAGRNGRGEDGLVGYLLRVAEEDVKAFAGLLGKVLPLQVTGDNGEPLLREIRLTVVDPVKR